MSYGEVFKHIKTILKVNPDTTEDELVAFMHLLGYGDAYVQRLMPKLRRLEKAAKKHPKKRSDRHRIHVCVKQVTRIYKEHPSIPEQKLLKLVEIYVHNTIKSKQAKRCIAGVHKHFHEQNKKNSRVLPVQTGKTRAPTVARAPTAQTPTDAQTPRTSALWSRIKRYINGLVRDLKSRVIKGAAGPPGPQGPIGKRGARGEKGETGEKGDRGEVGDQGPKARKVNAGKRVTKETVAKLAKMEEMASVAKRGATGLQGEKGDKGERGEKGNEGVGLHLKEWKLGKKYKKGDYVFITVVSQKQKKNTTSCSYARIQLKPQRNSHKMIRSIGFTLKRQKANKGKRAPKARKEIGAMWARKARKGRKATVEKRATKAIEVKKERKALVAKKESWSTRRKGDRGERGERGVDGEAGKQGPVGPKGDIGNIGPRGAKGERGDQGIKGDQGDAGDGLTLRTFKLGHHYRRADYVIYRPKGKKHDIMYIAVAKFKATKTPDRDPRNWSPFHAPRGPKGDKGDRGEDGKDGVRGPGGDPRAVALILRKQRKKIELGLGLK